MNNIQVFNYEGSRQVRTVEKDGEAWFVGKDVAEILGYKNPNEALLDHVDEEDKLNSKSLSSLGQRGGWLINESGLYSLILSSKLPDAKKFKRWVTSEVLPSIHKTGYYAVPVVQTQIDTLVAENNLLREKVNSLIEQIKTDRSFTALGRVISLNYGLVSFSEAGKVLAQNGVNIGPNKLLKLAREKGLLCKCKGRRRNQPTQKAIKEGTAVLVLNFGSKGTAFLTAKGLKSVTDEFVDQIYPLLALIEGGEAVNG